MPKYQCCLVAAGFLAFLTTFHVPCLVDSVKQLGQLLSAPLCQKSGSISLFLFRQQTFQNRSMCGPLKKTSEGGHRTWRAVGDTSGSVWFLRRHPQPHCASVWLQRDLWRSKISHGFPIRLRPAARSTKLPRLGSGVHQSLLPRA